MEPTTLEILDNFPCMSLTRLSLNGRNEIFCRGFIILEPVVRVGVLLPEFPSCQDASIFVDLRLQLEENINQDFIQVLRNSPSLLDLLNELRNKISSILNVKDDDPNAPGQGSALSLLAPELEAIGAKNISKVSEDYSCITLKCSDLSGRIHELVVKIPQNYPDSAPSVSNPDLPIFWQDADSFKWQTTVENIFKQFQTLVSQFTIFWDDVSEIDDNCDVIDPPDPTFKHTHRKILMDGIIIANININPLKSRELPEIRLSGPDAIVEQYDKLLDSNLQKWNRQKSLKVNLEETLCCTFCKSKEVNQTNNETVCVICYSYLFENEVPAVTCDCGSPYHNKCLYELLINDFSTKALKKIVECPVCSKEIKVRTSLMTDQW